MRFSEAGRRLRLDFESATAAQTHRRNRRPAFLWLCARRAERETLLVTRSSQEIHAGMVPFDLSLDAIVSAAAPANDRLHVIFPEPTPQQRLDIAVHDIVGEFEDAGLLGRFPTGARP